MDDITKPMTCFQDGPWFAPLSWDSLGGPLHLTLGSESDEGDSTKRCTNMEPNPGHLVQIQNYYPQATVSPRPFYSKKTH